MPANPDVRPSKNDVLDSKTCGNPNQSVLPVNKIIPKTCMDRVREYRAGKKKQSSSSHDTAKMPTKKCLCQPVI